MKEYSNIGFYPTEIAPNQKTIQQVLNDVLQILLKQVDLRAIYCFGYQSQSFTKHNVFWDASKQKEKKWGFNLLLIGKNIPANSIANLADIVKQQSEDIINFNLFCYSPKQIVLSNNEHKHLFAKIIQSGWLIYGEPHELASLKLDNLPDLDFKNIITYSKNRLIIAERLLENALLFFDQPLVAAFMLRNSVEQVCLGILYAFIHYHPNQFSVQYLVQLCKSCCDVPASVFPDSLFQKEELKELLKSSVSDLRFRSTDRFSKEEVQLLHQNCLAFYKQVVPILQKRISQLKSKTYENKSERK